MTTVDATLDAGAHGLRYFDEFLPRARRITGADVDAEQIRARYDQQRGLDLEALAADVDRLGRSLDIASEQLADQRARIRSLETNWTGGASETARNSLRGHADRAEHDQRSLGAAHDAMGESVRSLKSVVEDKARSVGGYEANVDGKSGADVDRIIDGARSGSPDLVATFPDLAGATPEQVVERCATWLTDVFIPHVREHLAHFDELCATVDRAVRDVYDQLTGSLDAVDEPSTPATQSDDPQFDFDKGGELVTGVAKVATVLGNAVVGAAVDAVDGFLDRIQADPSDAPDAPTDAPADYTVNGHHLRIEQQPDSDLTLLVGDRSFEMAIGDDGTPVVDPIEPPELNDSRAEELETAPEPEPPGAPAEEPPREPEPAAPMPPAAPVLHSRSESTPSGDNGVLAEAGPQPDEDPETGAELAEAGPL